MGRETGPMKRNHAEFIREKFYQERFFHFKHQLCSFGVYFGVAPLTQPRGPHKAIMDLGLGQPREATGSSSAAPLSLLSHQNSPFLNLHLHTTMWNIGFQI